MKRWTIFVFFMCSCLVTLDLSICKAVTNEEILRELEAMKSRIIELEKTAKEKDREINELKGLMEKKQETPGVLDEMDSEESLLGRIREHIRITGLIEVGAAAENVDNRDGTDIAQSDLNLTTLALGIEAEVNEWVHTGITLLFEDAAFGGESGFDLDEGVVTIGNLERFPLYFAGGAMYVPFGALLTHFPDDPLVDQPLTLLLGETREKAALLGFEHSGLSLSGYVFNGDLEESSSENHIEHYGMDAHYEYVDEKRSLAILVGAAYINSIAEADAMEETLAGLGTTTLQDYVGGFDAYLHLGFFNFFFDAEYMTATEDFMATELATGNGTGAQPAVWNFEGGFNWNWGRNLEVALKYAGSDEAENLGFPESRYGLALNQTLRDGVTLSLAYLHDEFHQDDIDGRDERDVVFGQMAIGF